MGERSKFFDPGKVPLKKRADGNIWATLVSITQFLLVVCVVAAIALWFLPVIQKTKKLQQEKELNTRKIAQAMEQNKQLQQEVELLKTDPVYVERLARDRLNLGKPGEVIFRFDPYPENAPATRNAANP
jgi:cell division protein FtsB